MQIIVSLRSACNAQVQRTNEQTLSTQCWPVWPHSSLNRGSNEILYLSRASRPRSRSQSIPASRFEQLPPSFSHLYRRHSQPFTLGQQAQVCRPTIKYCSNKSGYFGSNTIMYCSSKSFADLP